ncbi:MAG: triose-phosphate isomerase [Planctomycetaceae bacterium]
MMRRMLVAGNWKMNSTLSSAEALSRDLLKQGAVGDDAVEVMVCPPFPYLSAVRQVIGDQKILLGAQNCYFEPPGAFTGEIAVAMLTDVGCTAVILGHSERRHVLGETDDVIQRKTKAALAAGLDVILCVGERLEERQGNQTDAVLEQQISRALQGQDENLLLQHLVIAYEPVWAIGTGLTASPAQAESAHIYLRNWLAMQYNPQIAQSVRILYGGSVKGDNARELLSQPNVDGALVGGASLKCDLFLPIIQAARDVAKSK